MQMRPMSELHKAMMASHDSIPEESTISEPQSFLNIPLPFRRDQCSNHGGAPSSTAKLMCDASWLAERGGSMTQEPTGRQARSPAEAAPPLQHQLPLRSLSQPAHLLAAAAAQQVKLAPTVAPAAADGQEHAALKGPLQQVPTSSLC